MKIDIEEIRNKVASIHVYKSSMDSEGGEVTILHPQKSDVGRENHAISKHFLEGDGSKENPFGYLSSVDVSPYYSIIDLWIRFREGDDIFIKSNDWILKVNPHGVISEDGYFNKFI